MSLPDVSQYGFVFWTLPQTLAPVRVGLVLRAQGTLYVVIQLTHKSYKTGQRA